MRCSPDVILMYLRWYEVYPLSYRHLEKMMQDSCVPIGHSSSNRKAILRILRICFRAAALMQVSARVHSRINRRVPIAPRPIWQLTLFPCVRQVVASDCSRLIRTASDISCSE